MNEQLRPDSPTHLRRDPMVAAWITAFQRDKWNKHEDCRDCGWPHAKVTSCGYGSTFGVVQLGGQKCYVHSGNVAYLREFVAGLDTLGFHWQHQRYFARVGSNVVVSYVDFYNNNASVRQWTIPVNEFASIVCAASVGGETSERYQQALALLTSSEAKPSDVDFWRCKTCGCLWRDNHDGTVSLGSVKQTSCSDCEMAPAALVCEPLARMLLVTQVPPPDVVCEHGHAMDVHCCHCHSGFIFDRDHECPEPSLATIAKLEAANRQFKPEYIRCTCNYPGDDPKCEVDHDQIQHMAADAFMEYQELGRQRGQFSDDDLRAVIAKQLEAAYCFGVERCAQIIETAQLSQRTLTRGSGIAPLHVEDIRKELAAAIRAITPGATRNEN